MGMKITEKCWFPFLISGVTEHFGVDIIDVVSWEIEFLNGHKSTNKKWIQRKLNRTLSPHRLNMQWPQLADFVPDVPMWLAINAYQVGVGTWRSAKIQFFRSRLLLLCLIAAIIDNSSEWNWNLLNLLLYFHLKARPWQLSRNDPRLSSNFVQIASFFTSWFRRQFVTLASTWWE